MLDNLINEYDSIRSTHEALKSKDKKYINKSLILALSALIFITALIVSVDISYNFIFLGLVIITTVVVLINLFNKDYRKMLSLEYQLKEFEQLIFEEVLKKYELKYNQILFRFLDEYKPKLVRNLMIFKSKTELAIFFDWNAIKKDLTKITFIPDTSNQLINENILDAYYLIVPTRDIIGTIQKKRVINDELNASRLIFLNSSIKRDPYFVELKFKVDRQHKSVFLPIEALEYLSDF
jgi:hypothetical protein